MTDRFEPSASPAPQDWIRAPEQSVEDNPWKVALEASGVGVWEWDLVRNIQTHSQRWEEMLGYGGGELVGGYAEFIRMVHPDDIVPLQAAVTAYLAGLEPDYIADLRMRHKNGHWVWIMSYGTIVSRDAEGRPLRLLGTHTDISARKQAEAELRELNAQLQEQTRLLQTTTASISQGIFVFNAEMSLISFNQRVCEILDMPESFLAERPSLLRINSFQFKRGDFGPQAQLVDEHARDYVLTGGKTPLPAHFLRDTPDGRTLEVKSQMLPDGGMVRTFADVSDYVQAQAARKRLDMLLTAMQSQAQVGAWEVDVATDRVYWTEGVYRILQTSPEEYTPSTAMESAERVFTPASMEKVHARALAFDTDLTVGIELEAVTFRGNTIWVYVTGTSVRANGKLVSRIGVMQNITERKQAQMAVQETEDRWRLALESTGDGVWDWHIQSGVEYLSKRLVEMYGFQEGEIPDLPTELDKRTHPDDLAQMERDRNAHFSGLTSIYSNEHRVRCKDGSWKWVLSRGMVISRDAQGRPARMIGTHTDITERKASEVLIRQQAFFDTLTGLPNRRMLRDRLEQEIKRCKRDVQQLAILFIDLDHFKEVNDTLGHDSGDLLLQEAARRIQHCVREADTVPAWAATNSP